MFLTETFESAWEALNNLIEEKRSKPDVSKSNRAKVALFNYLVTKWNDADIKQFFVEPNVDQLASKLLELKQSSIFKDFDNYVPPVDKETAFSFNNVITASKAEEPKIIKPWQEIDTFRTDTTGRGIYVIKHKDSGRIYIGETDSGFHRISDHFKESNLTGDSTFHSLISHLGGESAFVAGILKDMPDATTQEIKQEEINQIKTYKTYSSWLDFNCAPGGTGGQTESLNEDEKLILLQLFLNSDPELTYPQLAAEFRSITGATFDDTSVERWAKCFTAAGQKWKGTPNAKASLLKLKDKLSSKDREIFDLRTNNVDENIITLNGRTFSGGIVKKDVLLCPWSEFKNNNALREVILSASMSINEIYTEFKREGVNRLLYFKSVAELNKYATSISKARYNVGFCIYINANNRKAWQDLIHIPATKATFTDLNLSDLNFKQPILNCLTNIVPPEFCETYQNMGNNLLSLFSASLDYANKYKKGNFKNVALFYYLGTDYIIVLT